MASNTEHLGYKEMDSTELITKLEQAFDSVDRPSVSMHQLWLTDQYGMSGKITPKDWAQAGKSRTDSSWLQISDFDIEQYGCVLAHMDAQEYQYFLPAYMKFSVVHHKKDSWGWESDIITSTLFSLNPSREKGAELSTYSITQLASFTREQKIIIISFLEFLQNHADEMHQPDAKKALEQYWNQISKI